MMWGGAAGLEGSMLSGCICALKSTELEKPCGINTCHGHSKAQAKNEFTYRETLFESDCTTNRSVLKKEVGGLKLLKMFYKKKKKTLNC